VQSAAQAISVGLAAITCGAGDADLLRSARRGTHVRTAPVADLPRIGDRPDGPVTVFGEFVLRYEGRLTC
jgi:hypothetical protein